MDLSETLNNYCERIGPEFWAEPWNAVTNAVFLIVALGALVMWRKKTPDDRVGLLLIVIVLATGIGSFLFHTFATRWAMLADIIPITLFIYLYLLCALRRFLCLPWVIVIAMLIGFVILSPMVGEVWQPVIGSSAFYLPALLAIFVVGGFFYGRNARLGRDVLLTGVLFATSLTFRGLDGPVCGDFAMGTHFLWHIFNGVVLFSLLRVLIVQRAEYTQ